MFLSRLFNWINDIGREPTLKEKWVKELRSGKYKQTRNTLYRYADGEGGAECDPVSEAASFCCLGVLAAVIDPNSLKYPNEGVLESMGVTHVQCVVMNDTEEKNFNEIADYIEGASNDRK